MKRRFLLVIVAAMTSEKYEEYSQIDMGAEDYAEVMRNFIASSQMGRYSFLNCAEQ